MATYNETIIDNTAIIDPLMYGLIEVVVDNATLSDSTIGQAVAQIIETINASDILIPQGYFDSNVVESVEFSETVRLLFEGLIAENVTVADSIGGLAGILGSIIESIELSDTLSNTANLTSVIITALTLADLAEQAYRSEVLDNLEVTDTIIDLFRISTILVEVINLSETLTDVGIFGVLASDAVDLNSFTSFGSIFSNELVDSFQFIGAIDTDDVYSTVVINPEGYAVTTYTNFEFNSVAGFNGSYLMANSTGLYRYGGDQDLITTIIAKLKTAALDFGTSSRKQVKKMYLGLANDSSVVLKVTVDGQGTYYYELDSSTVGLDTQAIKIGKGLVGRYWQFELVTKDNSDFELDEIEFLPVEFKRKL